MGTYANTRMKARYNPMGYIDEKTGGISYLETVKGLLKQAEEDWPALLACLENIRNTILNAGTCRDGMFLDVTGDRNVLDKVQPNIEQFLKDVPGNSEGSKLPNFYAAEHPWVSQAKKEMADLAPLEDEGFIVPTQVSYVGKGGRAFSPGEVVSGSSAVVSKFLRTGYLWDNVRVIGGAYDGTADALDAAADAFEADPDALSTAIIGAIGDMDSALSADQKGWAQFNRWLVRESPEHRQQYRDEVINTKPSDFRDFADRLRNLKDPSVAVVSSKGAFEAAAEAGKEMKLTEVV